MSADDPKQRAAAAALAYVEPGMKLGLGTGSTASRFVAALGEKVAAGLKIVGVPTSEATRAQAASLGIPLTTLEETPELDLTIDGADEVDAELRLIKGGGGALLREKIVAASSRRMLVVADASKKVARLGAFPLPVEIVPFGAGSTRIRLERACAALGLGGAMTLRRNGRRAVRHRRRTLHPGLRFGRDRRSRAAGGDAGGRARRRRARPVPRSRLGRPHRGARGRRDPAALTARRLRMKMEAYMKTFFRRGRGALVAALLAAALGAGAARADDPTPDQVDLAKKILVSVGLKASMDQIVPAMLGQLQSQVSQIHPEMQKPLHETLVALMPEFQQGGDSVFTDVARTLANRLTEAELKQTLDYFDSPAGKKYTDAQAAVLEMLASSGGMWRERLTKIMLDRTREEMKKKGFVF